MPKKVKRLEKAEKGKLDTLRAQTLFNDGYLPFCCKLYHSRLYKSHGVLQNTVTYWILCKFTTPKEQVGSEILEQHAKTFDHCVEHANDSLVFFRSQVMAPKGGYKRISGGDDNKVNFASSLFFRWMNGVFKKGSQRPLDQNDFLPLSEENSGRFVTDRLRKRWESEKRHCKTNGKRPKLWKSVFDMLSAKDVIIILTANILSTTSRLLFPLFLGYLVSRLMSPEAENDYQLYTCALAMCLNGLIGGLGMHQQDYRCETLGIKIGSALRGLVYHKVGTIQKSILCIFQRLNRFF